MSTKREDSSGRKNKDSCYFHGRHDRGPKNKKRKKSDRLLKQKIPGGRRITEGP